MCNQSDIFYPFTHPFPPFPYLSIHSNLRMHLDQPKGGLICGGGHKVQFISPAACTAWTHTALLLHQRLHHSVVVITKIICLCCNCIVSNLSIQQWFVAHMSKWVKEKHLHYFIKNSESSGTYKYLNKVTKMSTDLIVTVITVCSYVIFPCTPLTIYGHKGQHTSNQVSTALSWHHLSETAFYVGELEHGSWAFQESKHKTKTQLVRQNKPRVDQNVRNGGRDKVVIAEVNTGVNICLRGAMSQIKLWGFVPRRKFTQLYDWTVLSRTWDNAHWFAQQSYSVNFVNIILGKAPCFHYAQQKYTFAIDNGLSFILSL